MSWDGFISFVNVSTGYVEFVSLNDCIYDKCFFLVDIVKGSVVAEGATHPVCVICPFCFVEVHESFSLVCFGMFLGYECGGKYG